MFLISKIKIPLAEKEEAEILRSISVSAFKDNFENYGHYPPGIELVEWHQDKIKSGNYHTILYDEKIVGGLYVTSHPNED